MTSTTQHLPVPVAERRFTRLCRATTDGFVALSAMGLVTAGLALVAPAGILTVAGWTCVALAGLTATLGGAALTALRRLEHAEATALNG